MNKRLISLLVVLAVLLALPFYAWAEGTYSITFNPGAHATGEGKTVTLPFGPFEGVPTSEEELAEYDIAPEDDYRFYCWLVDEGDEGDDEQWEYYHEDEGEYFVWCDAVFTADWIAADAPMYTLYIDVNGSPDSKGETTAYEGKNFFLPGKVIAPQEGQAFAGWDVYAADDDGKAIGNKLDTYSAYETITATKNLVAVAAWDDANQDQFQYTVTFKKDDSSNAETITDTTHEGYYVLPECSFTNDGKSFAGWRRNGVVMQPNTSYYVNDDMEFTAVWNDGTTESCTVTFLPNYGDRTDAEERGMPAGSEFTLDAAFTREDYNLIGWSTNPNGGADYALGTKVTFFADTTLYAVWQPKYVTLTLKKNNGTEEGQDNTQDYGTEFSLALPDGFTYTDHEFAGWAESATGPVRYTAADTIKLTENKTLYARWKSTKATLTLYKNDGTSEATEHTQDVGANFQLQAQYTRDNYTLKGWSTSADGPVEYAVTETIKLDVDMTLYAVWEKNPETYTVTFDANGGSGSMAVQTFTENQAKALTPNAFTRDGFVFAGWNTKADGSGDTYIDNENVTMSSSITLYAVWVEQYTVRFEFPPNGTLTDAQKFASVTVNAGSTFTLPTIDGYEVNEAQVFMAWNVLDESNQPLHNNKNAGYSFEVTCNTVIIPVLESKVFTLKYKANLSDATPLDTVTGIRYGTQYEPKAVTEFPTITNPDSENYEFNCWTVYDDDTGKAVGEAYVDNEEYTFHVEWNCTLVPNWVHKTETYQLTIVYTDDEIFDEAKQPGPTPKGAFYELPPAQLIQHQDDLEFDHWEVTMNGETYAVEPLGLLLAEGNATAKAVWKDDGEEELCTITFDKNGGTGGPMESLTVNKYTNYYLPECKFTAPDGYKFAGWSVYESTSTLSQAGELVTVSRDLNIKAVWVKLVYDISFDAGENGSGSMAPLSKEYGAEFELPACGFTANTGYQFAGWLIEGETELHQPGYQFIPTDSVKITAQWETADYTVTFDENAADATGSMADQTFTYDVAQALTANSFARSGYMFTGWNTQANGSGTAYSDKQNTKFSADTTLYAQWTAKQTYTVKFNANVPDGETYSGTMNDQIFTQDEYQNLTKNAFVRPGWKFIGWNTADEPMVLTPDEAYITVISNMTLNAQWEQEVYTVTFTAGEGTGSREVTDLTYGSQIGLGLEGVMPPQHYKFDYWKLEGDETKYTPDMSYTVTGSVTFVAIWTPETEGSMTYHSGYEPEVTYTYNGAYREEYVLLDPNDSEDNAELGFTAPQGKKFSYWEIGRIDESGSWVAMDSIDAGGMMTLGGKLHVRAVWIDLSDFLVSFNANGGSGSEQSQSVKENSEYTLPEISETGITPVRGKTFRAWSVTMNGSTTEMASGTKIEKITGNVTLKALWDNLGEYTISFASNGGTGTMSAAKAYDGEEYTLPSNGFTAPEGKTFDGWLVNSMPKQPGEKITVSANTTVTAQWKPIICTISFSAGDGTGTMDSVTKNYGETCTLPTHGFTAPGGKVFDRWIVNGTEMKAGEGFTVTGNITVTAQWADGTLNITFALNGGTQDNDKPMNSTTAEYGSAYTIPECSIYAPLAQDFDYWSVNGTAMDPGQTISELRTHLMLTPIWKDFTYVKQESLESALTDESLPADLKNNGITTVEEVITELETKVETLESSGYSEERAVHLDIELQVWDDTKGENGEFVPATPKIMQELGSIDVMIEIPSEAPQGDAASNYDFMVLHMITVGDNAGKIETVPTEIVDGQIKATFTSLSPVTIIWKEKVYEGAIADLPKTGDPSSLLGWITLLGASGLGMKAIRRRKK